jgi:hypothetical protein
VVRNQLSGEPLDAVWVFHNKRRTALKLLWWDHGGFVVAHKKLRMTLVLSWFNKATIVELDATSGQVLRSFGETLADSYTFAPTDSWFYAQHFPHFVQGGTLLLTSSLDWGEETALREYEVDVDTNTLRQVWSWGEGLGYIAEQVGDSVRLGDGHTLINYGTSAEVREVTPEGELVWEVYFEAAGGGSRTGVLGRMEPIWDLYQWTDLGSRALAE